MHWKLIDLVHDLHFNLWITGTRCIKINSQQYRVHDQDTQQKIVGVADLTENISAGK